MRFFKDIYKYRKYLKYAVKADLKTEVANSYLGWLWWLIEPVCFMFIYIFIAVVIFGDRGMFFPLVVFSGLTFWNFFNKNVTASVSMIRKNKNTVQKVYLPKFILIFIKMGVNTVKMSVSFVLIIIMMIFYQVDLTMYVFWAIPLFILLFLVTFAFCCLCMHVGVFVEDLGNVIPIVLRLVFYMSGIFFIITDRLDPPFSTILLNVNPLALIIDSFRNSLIFGAQSNLLALGIWLAASIVLSILGVFLIYKYENTYVKVIK